MKVLIVAGGSSDEREISLLSSENVTAALKKNGHRVKVIDFNKGYSEILKSARENDVVFPVLHGLEGESGKLQKVLEEKSIKFVGSGSKACEIGWNKVKFKEFCKKLSIKTAPWFVLSIENVKSLYKNRLPSVIKPIDSGSSVDVFIIKSEKDFQKIDFEKLLKKYKELLVEDYIDGIEITAGVLNDIALPIVEIIPPEGEWFSYENKYSGRTKEIPNAPSLTFGQQSRVKKIALKIHNRLGCRHMSRTDFIFRNGDAFALEINTIPGLTKQSLLPKAALAAGITFDEVTDRLVKIALND